MDETRRMCALCGKDLFDKGISLADENNVLNGYHPECFVARLNQRLEKGDPIEMFGDMPLEEQKAVINDPDFVEAMAALSILEPGQQPTDPRFSIEKLDEIH